MSQRAQSQEAGVARWAALLVLFAIPAVLFAMPAAAAGDSEGGGGMLWHLINFCILVVVLVIVARKPILGFFADRREEISDDIGKASGLLDEATARYSDWQRKVVELEEELETIRGHARHWAEEERNRILDDARASAERMKREASAAIEQEVRRAKTELGEEASQLALELAEGLLKEQVSASDRDRLMDEFISSVERPSAGHTPDTGR